MLSYNKIINTKIVCLSSSFTLLIISTAILIIISTTTLIGKPTEDLLKLSIEDLSDLEVYSPSKRSQKFIESTAATFIITAEDIKRSGFTSIADALRIVPGVQVAKVDANKWAISARGFNGIFANKLLVLIDGRSVYTPLFSGVFWEAQDVLLEDIEQIEIIRGPGATLWGANAVNGIINIITKKAAETQGRYIKLGAGTEELDFGSIRCGGKFSENIHYRFYVKYFDRDGYVNTVEQKTADKWSKFQSGYRFDWDITGDDLLTIQGDLYNGKVGQMCRIIPSLEELEWQNFDSSATFSGANILCRLDHILSVTSDMTFQIYYDRSERNDVVLSGALDAIDVELIYRAGLWRRHQLVCGLGYRHIHDNLSSTFFISVKPESRQMKITNAFFQDEIWLWNDRFSVTLGSKFEHNDYTGMEIQPMFRFFSKLHRNNIIWGAVSRAVRTPSRMENDMEGVRDVLFYSGIPGLFLMTGNKNFKSENLLAYELGYRFFLKSDFLVDLAVFYNDYTKLRTYEAQDAIDKTQANPRHVVLPLQFENNMTGTSYGTELSVDRQFSKKWRLHVSYSYLKLKMYVKDLGIFNSLAKGTEKESPQNQFSLSNSLTFFKRLNFDIGFYYVDRVPTLDVNKYFNLNMRLALEMFDNLQLSVVGQNLLESSHFEYAPTYSDIRASKVERGIYGMITYKF